MRWLPYFPLNCTIILTTRAYSCLCSPIHFFPSQKDICQLFSATSYFDEVDELSKTFSKTSCQKNAIRNALPLSKLIRKMTGFNGIWKWLKKFHFSYIYASEASFVYFLYSNLNFRAKFLSKKIWQFADFLQTFKKISQRKFWRENSNWIHKNKRRSLRSRKCMKNETF